MGRILAYGAIAFGLVVLNGCYGDQADTDGPISAYRERMLARHSDEADNAPGATSAQVARRIHQMQQGEPLVQPADDSAGLQPRLALPVGATAGQQPTAEELLAAIPDPTEAASTFNRRLDALGVLTAESRVVESYKKVIARAEQYLESCRRPRQIRLSLADCVERAMRHNYTIRIHGYNPAIRAAQLVEAEAAFDAEFFLDAGYQQQDADAIVRSGTEQVDSRTLGGGIRKLLATGMSAQVGMNYSRTGIDSPDLPKGTNPSYGVHFTAELRQPLLRGFGLQVNRSQIEIARTNRKVSYWQFVAEVRDQLQALETAYWSLVQARRNLAILAESVAQNWVTKEDIYERREHDVTPVEIANSEARYQIRYVEFLESVRILKDAEEALKNLINDPELKLSEDIEIIPTDIPLATPLTLDQFAEVRTALEKRSEIRQARLGIEALRISTAAAKNQTLPQLDLTFSYDVHGAAASADNAWDRMSQNDFISYGVGVQFSYPFGNRARQAALRSQRLQESQATVQLEQIMDGVVQEVNSSVRSIIVRYAQLPEQLGAVQSSERNLRSLQARATSINPSFLETELSAVEQLSSSRTRLLQVLISYNTGIIDLERAKGTLLEYNNIVLEEKPPAD